MVTTDGKTTIEVVKEISVLLLAQGTQCLYDCDTIMDPAADCAYGNTKGEHCSLGFLFPEDRDDLMGFRGGISGLITAIENDEYPTFPNYKWVKDNQNLLSNLQTVHDLPAYSTVVTVELLLDAKLPDLHQWVRMI